MRSTSSCQGSAWLDGSAAAALEQELLASCGQHQDQEAGGSGTLKLEALHRSRLPLWSAELRTIITPLFRIDIPYCTPTDEIISAKRRDVGVLEGS